MNRREQSSYTVVELEGDELAAARAVNGPAFWIHSTVQIPPSDIVHIMGHIECILRAMYGKTVSAVCVVGTVDDDEEGEHLLYGVLGMEDKHLASMINSAKLIQRIDMQPFDTERMN